MSVSCKELKSMRREWETRKEVAEPLIRLTWIPKA
jgi:hypothetical protein